MSSASTSRRSQVDSRSLSRHYSCQAIFIRSGFNRSVSTHTRSVGDSIVKTIVKTPFAIRASIGPFSPETNHWYTHDHTQCRVDSPHRVLAHVIAKTHSMPFVLSKNNDGFVLDSYGSFDDVSSICFCDHAVALSCT